MKNLALLAMLFGSLFLGCEAMDKAVTVMDVVSIFAPDSVEHEGVIESLTIFDNRTEVKFKDGYSYSVPGHTVKRPGDTVKIIKTDSGFKLE